MKDPTKLIVQYRKIIVTIFFIFAIAGGILQFGVPVNYNMTDYLPKNAPSTIAMEVMDEEFEEAITNTRVMLKDVDIQEALTYKEALMEVDGVQEIMWLDDVMDLTIPIEMIDQDTLETYYLERNALFTLAIEEGMELEATNEIYEIIGKEHALAGEAVKTAVAQQLTGKETLNAAAILIPIIIIILLLSTRSWIEPVFFLTAIGVSVLINLGTNIFIGEISFISQAVAPILQLAVSLDYAIFLMHSFDDYRKEMDHPKEAMQQAIKRSFPAITASASTTFFGFMALTFMKFEIGADLGINLVKGILLSFLSVMVFLPALTLTFYKWIDRTKHREFLPSKYKIGRPLLKMRIPVLIFVILFVVPAFLAQSQTNFIYGMGDIPYESRAGRDTAEIEQVFGKFTPMVLLVKKGDLPREEQLIVDLQTLPEVKSVIAYTNTVGITIPLEYLDESIQDQFFSENYSRIIINTVVDDEGKQSFQLVENVQEITEKYYSDDFYLTGKNVTLYDMKTVIEKDNTFVNLLTVITIAFVLLLTFKSLTLPIVLLLTIQVSVWFNLAIPYIVDDSLVYIGYLIISIVQLAATVDYAILFTDEYMNARKTMPKREAAKQMIHEKIFSIGVPASILSSVGFILWLTSTDPIISSIGILLGRGTVFAFILVVLLLPALLLMFDRLILKTTFKASFYEER